MRFGGPTRRLLIPALALALVLSPACSRPNAHSPRSTGAPARQPASVTTPPPAASAPITDPPAYDWAKRYRLIAHGMGAIDGIGQSNTREAFEQSYAKGYRIFEVDFVSTRDGELVARHDWTAARYARFGQKAPPGGVPTLAQFKAMKVRGKYTPLSAADVVDLMREHRDAWVMTDIKDLSVKGRTHALRELLDATTGDKSVRDRIIVQIYSEGDLKPTRTLGFRNILYTFYRLETPVDRAIKFADANDIRVVTFPKSWATKALIGSLRRHGIRCATHTVNDADEEQRLYNRGVRLFYSDRLKP